MIDYNLTILTTTWNANILNKPLKKQRQSYWIYKQDLHMQGREGNGTPLQHSCLENPMDGGAW